MIDSFCESTFFRQIQKPSQVTLVSQSTCFAHEGRLRVTLVSRNARFAHEGRLRVTLVSQSACFAHEGLGT